MSPIKGKEFEQLILFRAQKMEEQKILTMGRYGVQVVMMNDEGGVPRWQPMPSLPDFDGCIHGTGRQLIIEAKVCSQASYPIANTGGKNPKQIDHMLKRAAFGALCYLLIHFNPRVLIKRSDPAETFAIPVNPDEHFWREYLNCERRTLSRDEARTHGVEVPWSLYSPRATKLTPDLSCLLPDKQNLTLKS